MCEMLNYLQVYLFFSDSLCAGTRERYLSAVGEESSIVLPLSPIQNIQGVSTSQSGPCRARITAPDSHAIGINISTLSEHFFS